MSQFRGMAGRGERGLKTRGGEGKGGDNNNDLSSYENEAPVSPWQLKGKWNETDAAIAAEEEQAALDEEQSLDFENNFVVV